MGRKRFSYDVITDIAAVAVVVAVAVVAGAACAAGVVESTADDFDCYRKGEERKKKKVNAKGISSSFNK